MVQENSKRKKTPRIELVNALLKKSLGAEIRTKKKAEGAGKKARELPPPNWPEGTRNDDTLKTLTIRGDSNSVVAG